MVIINREVLRVVFLFDPRFGIYVRGKIGHKLVLIGRRPVDKHILVYIYLDKYSHRVSGVPQSVASADGKQLNELWPSDF